MKHCPACNSDQVIRLGSLGRLAWYRCRHCGYEFPINTRKPRKEKRAVRSPQPAARFN